MYLKEIKINIIVLCNQLLPEYRSLRIATGFVNFCVCPPKEKDTTYKGKENREDKTDLCYIS